MTSTITLEVDEELMGVLRDVIVGLLRDAYEGDIRRERNHEPSGSVVGADRQCKPD